ncbi:MAG TPA: quinoprotein relay system zinc metallohydrolase 1 [Plasticicumulans sp.]|uniref:quinoprotein relay system zinc metallohydrolase 1 n=1 Tax=Plasticicumulans sp. TaxID=2307179 RepID=UPI002BFBEAC5|nr:quinoprotein relay system zinc metallohydrolase 1 [Plasticicumulans sp.]HMV39496.1 quinoprotein relay system zinc metallohydrolase 1 [Plasticicumulans sp.]HMW30097.1 quinoprotein relay system zinc metallohydrolase 1 [Plasticicumulans sp.]HMW41669.1 quinoprotein relay system zinc metallohydrolase 1 [Plasticicumulans sp.]HMX54823.1 quinoprotein relay system zinc metallohydrolase 1 [Plasticicumulans sp.]HMZ10028.1 quinoprotein relay system zinc metallohydrolase 1 [Plasticicumulans sp.]
MTARRKQGKQAGAVRAAALAFAVIVTVPLQAADTDYRLQPEPVAPGTYLVAGVPENFSRSNGGNIANTAFVVTGAGVVVIDTGPSKRYGQQLRAAIARVTAEPVVAVYLTHHHPDHALGNQAFADVPIRALPGTIEGLREQGNDFNSNLFRMVGDWMRGTDPLLPAEAVAAGSVRIGTHEFELIPNAGHTAADLAILDRTTGTLFSGSVFNGRTPATPNAVIADWIASLDRLAALNAERIVPAVGAITDNRAIAEDIDWLRWLDETLHEAAGRGADMAEVLRLPIPARFNDFALLREEYERSVSHLYPAIERASLGVRD